MEYSKIINQNSMKRFSFFAALMSMMTLGVSLTGCSSDEVIDEPIVKGDKLMVEAYLENTENETKAPISTWAPGSEMGLFVKSSGLSGADYGEVNGQVKAEYSNSLWTLNPEVSLTSSPAKVFAYYPYNVDVTDGTAVPVEIDSQTDYLYSGNAVSASANNSKIALSMKHGLCVFAFSVKSNGYIGDANKLTSINIRNKAGAQLFASEGTMDISTGVITKSAYNGFTITTDKTITSDGWTAGDQPLAMVMPFQTSATSQAEFVFTVDGKEYVVDVPANMNYQAGQQYLFRLTINSSSMELDAANITIVPWGEQTGVDLDDVMTKVKGLTYTLTTTSSAESHEIANVGAVKGTIDWGDNSAEESYAASKTHNFVSAGTYNVQIQAEDEINSVSVSSVQKIDEIDLSQLV